MSDKPLLPNGIYLANVESIEIRQTADGINFIESNLVVYPREKKPIKLHYRLPLTKGAAEKTFTALKVMGTKVTVKDLSKDDIDLLDGIDGTTDFYANCVTLECHDNEAYGKYRTYVDSIERLYIDSNKEENENGN